MSRDARDRVMLVNRVALPAEAPARVLVIPWGTVASKSGDMVVDAESAAAIVAAFARHGVDVPIDWEHQTVGGEYASPDGTAPAAAWIKSIQAEPGVGIWAEVEWTARGAAVVSSKEYRYLSPVVLVRRSDRKALALDSVALTNKPAIEAMRPIVNKESNVNQDKFDNARWLLNLPATATNEEILMELDKYLAQLRAELGLAADATAEQVTASVQALKADRATRVAVCKAMKLDATVSDADVVAAVNRLAAAPAPTAAVSVAEQEVIALKDTLKRQGDELATLRLEHTARRTEERIAAAKRDGKLTDAMLAANSAGKNFYRELAGGEQWDAWIATAPVVAPADGRLAGVAGAVPGSAAGSDRVAIINRARREHATDEAARKMGVSAESYVLGELIACGQREPLTDEEKKLLVA